MISQEKAHACLKAAAADLEPLSYRELERLAELHGTAGEWKIRELQVDGETIRISTTFSKIGRFRKRVSVELVLSVEGEEEQSCYPFIYFERYESGRFYPSPREETREAALLKSLPYALLVVVIIGLLAFVWHRFL